MDDDMHCYFCFTEITKEDFWDIRYYYDGGSWIIRVCKTCIEEMPYIKDE